jgi:hypothetical protein
LKEAEQYMFDVLKSIDRLLNKDINGMKYRDIMGDMIRAVDGQRRLVSAINKLNNADAINAFVADQKAKAENLKKNGK